MLSNIAERYAEYPLTMDFAEKRAELDDMFRAVRKVLVACVGETDAYILTADHGKK
jgi:hypothetical protein